MNETINYEVWKCMSLVKALIRRKQDPSLSLQNYSKAVYEKSLSELKKLEEKHEKQIQK